MRRPVHNLALADAGAVEILALGDPRAADPGLTGGKAASLSRLAAGHRVPPGFVVALPGATLDRGARAAVLAAYRRLGERCGVADPPVAVRSSAVDEDGADASFAGQHDTFLNVSRRRPGVVGDRALRRLVRRRPRARLPPPRRPRATHRPAPRSSSSSSSPPTRRASSSAPTRSPARATRSSSTRRGGSARASSRDRHAGRVRRRPRRPRDPRARGRRQAPHDRRRRPAACARSTFPAGSRRMPAIDAAQARAAAALAIALEREIGGPVDLEVAWAGPRPLPPAVPPDHDSRTTPQEPPPVTPARPRRGAADPAAARLPVVFEPGEDRLLWDRDRMHFPRPGRRRSRPTFVSTFSRAGWRTALERYDVPLAGTKTRALNGYLYTAFVPLDVPAAELAERCRRSEAALEATIARLEDAWEEEWLPEIREHLAAMEALDLARRRCPTVGLVDVLERSWEHMARALGDPLRGRVPRVRRRERVRRPLPPTSSAAASSTPTASSTASRTGPFEVGCDLWRLSRVALRSPEAAEVLATEAAADVPAALAATAGGGELPRGARPPPRGVRPPHGDVGPPDAELHRGPVAGHQGPQGLRHAARQREPGARARPPRERARRGRRRGARAPARLPRAGRRRSSRRCSRRRRSACCSPRTTASRSTPTPSAWCATCSARCGRRLVADGAIDDADDVLMLTYDELRVAALDLPGTDPRTLVRAAPREAGRARGGHAAADARHAARRPAAGQPAAAHGDEVLRAGRRRRPSPASSPARPGSAGRVDGRRARHRARWPTPTRLAPGRGPRRRDDRAAVDAALRDRGRGRDRHRRDPQPLRGRRARVRDPRGRRRRATPRRSSPTATSSRSTATRARSASCASRAVSARSARA